jgi:hypothetical protein
LLVFVFGWSHVPNDFHIRSRPRGSSSSEQFLALSISFEQFLRADLFPLAPRAPPAEPRRPRTGAATPTLPSSQILSLSIPLLCSASIDAVLDNAGRRSPPAVGAAPGLNSSIKKASTSESQLLKEGFFTVHNTTQRSYYRFLSMGKMIIW